MNGPEATHSLSLPDALAQLAEARETLRAISAGEVDAFLMSDGSAGHRVFTLATADRPYRMFVEHMRDGAATVAADGLVLYANDRLADLVGRPKQSIIGTTLALRLAGEAPESRFVLGGRQQESLSLELELVDDSGRSIPVLVGVSPLDVDGDHLTCLTFTDLTEERAKDAEISRLHRAELAAALRLAAVVDALQEGVLVQDGEGRVLQANRMASSILDRPEDQLVTEPPSALSWHHLVSDRRKVTHQQGPVLTALPDGLPRMGQIVEIDRNAELRWLEIDSVPTILAENPDVPVVISSFRDVTARVAAEDAMRFQAQLLDSAGQAITAVDSSGNVIYWNKHAEGMYGWTAAEAIGRSFGDLVLPELAGADGEAILATMRAGTIRRADRVARRRDGTDFPIFSTSTVAMDDLGDLAAVITVATDITERRRSEVEARHLSAIVESSSDAIFGMTLSHVITTWNPGARSLFGYSAEQAVGQSLALLMPTGIGRLFERLDGSADHVVTDLETVWRAKSGALVQISLSISRIFGPNEATVGFSGIARDITERVSLEQIAKRNRQQLLVAEHAAQLEAIARTEANRANLAKSDFLNQMSHELRTPLNAVLGFGQALQLQDLTVDQRECVTYIQQAGEHLLVLINDVLDIARIEAGAIRLTAEPVNLADVIDSALRLIRPQAAQRNVHVPGASGVPDDLYVHADRQRLLQVLLNLLSNAVKYNRLNGSIELHHSSHGDRVSFSVIDTGMGILAQDLHKLFTPFERLGAEGTDIEGTGVGLALARSLTEQMKGTLTAISTEGTGSTFTVNLQTAVSPSPRPDEMPMSAPAESTQS